MSNWELKIGPERVSRNPVTGRFVKGCTPHNKGKRWGEYMSKQKQEEQIKRLRQIRRDHPTKPKVKVVAVNNHGRFVFFDSVTEASIWAGTCDANIHHCCTYNSDRKVLRSTRGKLTGKVNTDHKCKGIRFYFKSDPIWMEKIKK